MDETLEDGEIHNSENMSSAPDQFTISRATREPQRICSDESSNDNSDNSDDDSDACSKPKKVKPLPPTPACRPEVPNKYKVWSIALQEESLMENLNRCDVEAINRDRSVESYNYKIHSDSNQYKSREMTDYVDEDLVKCHEERKYLEGRKRRHGDIKNRLGKKKEKLYSRRMPDLAVTAEDAVENVADDIASKLNETKVDLILKVVLVLGREKAIELYNETKGVEDNGGMLLMNGERRRTAGGVFLLLVKRDNSISSEDMKEIFSDDISRVSSKRRKATKRRFKKKFEDVKEQLIREKLLNLNTMVGVQSSDDKPSHVPTAESNNLEEGEVELNVANPPPSPATDQDTPPSRANMYSEDETEHVRRPITTYDDDDCLDVGLDAYEMDLL